MAGERLYLGAIVEAMHRQTKRPQISVGWLK